MERWAPEGFLLGCWSVEPQRNRLSRGEEAMALEPKLMDVLVFLAGRQGEVVSKQELMEAVWKTEFLTEWAVTRAIAKLRKALGDDAGRPRFIETITKRGYRLVAPVHVVPGEDGTADSRGSLPGLVGGTVVPTVPYGLGRWVRGIHFYGRAAQIGEILTGGRDCLWVLGTRVSGKTSLLRQLELLADSKPDRGLVPVYWDLQGAETPDDLDRDFSEALIESSSRLESAGVDPAPWLGQEFFAALGGVRRSLAARGRRLLLLCDEAEELLGLHRRSPAVLRKLRRALQGSEGVRTVLAASARLWQLARQAEDTSPFLHGFTPPVYLGPLSPQEAGDLAHQTKLAPEDRPQLDEETAARVCGLCGGHPYLLSLVCSRLLGGGGLDAAVAEVESDPTLAHLFAVDMTLLSEQEAELLATLARRSARGSPGGATLSNSVFQLERLGLVRRTEEGLAIGNHFLERWLRCAGP